jgi:hypothetical protein
MLPRVQGASETGKSDGGRKTMTRRYTLPEHLTGEDNWAWCQRAAAAIPAEALMRQLVEYLDKRPISKKRRRAETWSTLGMIFGHGSGVSSAIAERFRVQGEDHE